MCSELINQYTHSSIFLRAWTSGPGDNKLSFKEILVDERTHKIQVDLDKVIDEIVKAHQPISEHFKFLCNGCHRKYDKGTLFQAKLRLAAEDSEGHGLVLFDDHVYT